MTDKGDFSKVVNSLNRDPKPTTTADIAMRRLRKQGAIERLAKGLTIKFCSDKPIIFITDTRQVKKGKCFKCGNYNAMLFPVNSRCMPNGNVDMFVAACPDCKTIKPYGKYYTWRRKHYVREQQEIQKKEYIASLCPCGCGRPKKVKWAGPGCSKRFEVLDAIVRGVGPSVGDLTIQLNHTKKCLELSKVRTNKLNPLNK